MSVNGEEHRKLIETAHIHRLLTNVFLNPTPIVSRSSFGGVFSYFLEHSGASLEIVNTTFPVALRRLNALGYLRMKILPINSGVRRGKGSLVRTM